MGSSTIRPCGQSVQQAQTLQEVKIPAAVIPGGDHLQSAENGDGRTLEGGVE